MCSLGALCQAICCASGISSRRAAARTGAWRTWQTWQGVSGPLVCWWRKAPPAAKYSRATQPKIARIRRQLLGPESKLLRFIRLHTEGISLDGGAPTKVARGATLRGNYNLTPQPFLPKLRHSNYMPRTSLRIPILALLLGIVFLAAQFHFCADLTSDPTSSHFCPLCSATASAVVAPVPVISFVPATHRLESLRVVLGVTIAATRSTSPRAPPSI
jgi:hypothetical protein